MKSRFWAVVDWSRSRNEGSCEEEDGHYRGWMVALGDGEHAQRLIVQFVGVDCYSTLMLDSWAETSD